MKLHRGTWLAIAVAIVVFASLNLHCWRPGIGGRTDLIANARPVGSEVEFYFDATDKSRFWSIRPQ